jgi:hypothetical protein
VSQSIIDRHNQAKLLTGAVLCVIEQRSGNLRRDEKNVAHARREVLAIRGGASNPGIGLFA